MSFGEIDFGQAEAFHRFALDRHVADLVEECRRSTGEITDQLRLSIADAVAWAVRLRLDVLKADGGLPGAFLEGATWARHRVVHGDAHLLAVEWTSGVDRSWHSSDIVWNDPEVSWNGQLAAESPRTARFVEMPPVEGDKRPRLRDAYNQAVAGRRVVVVCALLAGESTLGDAFS